MKSSHALIAAAAVALSFAHAAPKPLPVPPTTPPGSTAILLGVESVQKELELTSLQRAVLNDIRNEYRDDARAVTAQVAAGKLSKKQGKAELDALTANSDRKALRVLNSSQRKRAGEIRHQIVGGYMLLSPDIQKKLSLTDKQKAEIARIWARGEKYASKVTAQYERGEISAYTRLIDLRESRLDRSDDFIALLTPEQLARFEIIAGDKFSG